MPLFSTVAPFERQGHPSVRFSLVPINDNAKAAATHPNNSYIARKREDGITVLDIGHFFPKSDNTTLATLGGAGDVFVEGPNISAIQSFFEIDPGSKDVMFLV